MAKKNQNFSTQKSLNSYSPFLVRSLLLPRITKQIFDFLEINSIAE